MPVNSCDRACSARVFEIEGVSHFHWPALMPFGWPHRLETGGGRLNNNFPHKLAIAQNILDGEILASMGESRNDLKKVPVGAQESTIFGTLPDRP